MSGAANNPIGNVGNIFILQPTLTFTPTTVAGTTGSEVTATVNGVQTNDFVYVNKPTTQSNIGIDNVRVSANNVIAIAFSNNSTATQTPTPSEVYTVMVVRGANFSTLPAAIE
jgi:hypothetical protein